MNHSISRIVICAIVGTVALAQDKSLIEPPALTARRDEHRRNMQRAALPLLTNYARVLEALKSQYIREAKLDAALAVGNELQQVVQQMQTANAAAARGGATMQLTILSAVYGVPAKKLVADITKEVVKAFQSGESTLTLNLQGAGGVDPAPYQRKECTIIYEINGQRKQKTFPEDHKLNFRDELR